MTTFLDAAERYLRDQQQGKSGEFEKQISLARRVVVGVTGNKDIVLYDRDDARAVLSFLKSGDMKTATIRRRIDTIRAIFGYAYIEGDIEKRNPVARLSISGEGLDAKKRGKFKTDQLAEIYEEAWLQTTRSS